MDTVAFSVGWVMGMITAAILILACVLLVEVTLKIKSRQELKEYLRNTALPPQEDEASMPQQAPHHPKPVSNSRTMHSPPLPRK